jgi:hypothetical protein
MARKPALLKPEDNLYTRSALLKFVDTNYGQIPVTRPGRRAEHPGPAQPREACFKAYSGHAEELKEEE